MALSKSLLFGGFLRPSLEVVVLIFLIPIFRILKTAPGVRFARSWKNQLHMPAKVPSRLRP